MAVEQPEKILIFTANPLSYARLRIDEEVRTIQNALRGSRKAFDVQLVLAARSEELRHEILYKKPAYVHFCGHGAPGGIVLDDHVVSAEALAGLFKLFSAHVRCVVLNACFSSRQADAIVAHVEHVVGMSAEIEDEAAIAFAAAFYDTLGAGQTVDFAFEAGVNGIQLAGKRGHLTPQLLSRAALAGRVEASNGLCAAEAIADPPSKQLSEAIADLRSGRVPPSGMDWHEFQKVVYHLISQRLQLQQDAKVSFSDHDREVVDIVLEYPTRRPTLQSSSPVVRVEKCFIECKRHPGHIELDSAAKVFCAAIHQRPSRLCWVTLDGLSPQAWDYARYFFRTDGADDRSLTEIGFEHVQLASLLGRPATDAADPAPGGRSSSVEALRVLDWQIVEQGTFYRQVVASAVAHPAVIRLQHGRIYMLRAWVSKPSWLSGAELQAALRAGGGVDPRFHNLRVAAASDAQLELEARVDTAVVARTPAGTGPLTFELRLNSDLAGAQEPFPDLRVEPSPAIFPDLRQDETVALAARFADPYGERIVFVSGEGGIGKSYLCQKAAEILAQNHGFTAHAHSVLAASEHLVLRIALSLLRPAQSGDPIGEPVLRELLDAWLAAEGSTQWSAPEAEGKTEQAGRRPAGGDALLVGMCAGLLAASHVPRLLYVQNCQDLSPQEIKALGLLIVELDSRGWGGLRLLLEYRTTNERTSAFWQTFVRNVLENFRPSKEVFVHPLDAQVVAAGVAGAFVTDDPAGLADTLIEKAGGNPLYLTQVIQHLVDLGACRAVETGDDNTRLVVHDQRLLTRRLCAIPDQLDGMLRSRLEQYVCFAGDLPTDEQTVFPEYLALLAAVGARFGRQRIAQALELPEEHLSELEWRLVRDQFLVHTDSGPGVDFVHDLMRLAAAAFGRDTAGFARRAQRLEALLDREIDREALVGGTLNLWLRRYPQALRWFDTVYERAEARGDFPLQREALLGSSSAVEPLPARTLQEKLKRIELLMALGWNEMQTGSQTEALRVFQSTHTCGEGLLRHGNVEERRLWRDEDARIRHHILTCMVHLQTVDDAIRLLDQLVPDIHNLERLFHVLNRYLLICYVTDLTHTGCRASRTACGLAEMLDPNCISVIMSDIGHLYMVSAPDRTRELWIRGRDTAQTPRQQTHSRTNTLVAGFLTGQPEPASEFDDVLATVVRTGVDGQLTRLFLYAGVCAARDAEWDQAHHWFEKALNNARICNQVVYEWQASNNLGVTSLIAGEPELSARHFSVAAALVSPLWGGWDRAAGERLVELFESRARDLCPEGNLHHLENNLVSGWSPPTISAPSWHLLYNLERLRDEGLPLLVPPAVQDAIASDSFRTAADILDRAAHPLAVQTRHERLALVIE